MAPPIYLDYNATTPVDTRVVEALLPYLAEEFGNASSGHRYGYRAGSALATAREQVAALLHAEPDEIVFTGGGSEANNHAIKGTCFAAWGRRSHIIAGSVDHPATRATLNYLRVRFGVEVTFVPVDEYGRIDPHDVAAALRPETVLVTIMHANNEVGTIQNLTAISERTRSARVLLHVDAAQSAGKTAIDVRAMGIDLLTIVGHKMYAPKGVGALFVRRGLQIDPLIHGASQEGGRRAGTENIPGAVALGRAAQLAAEELPEESERLRSLRDRLQQRLTEIPGVQLNGHPEARLCNTLNVSLPGVLGPELLAAAPSVAASTGSACHTSDPSPSPVLTAMGMSRERALGAIRLSIGRFTSGADIEQAAAALIAAYRQVAAVPTT